MKMNKKRILITGHLPGDFVESLSKLYEVEANTEDHPLARQKLLDSIKDKNGLLSMLNDNINEEVLEQAPQLQMIAHYGVGYNNIDTKAATSRGILVSHTPGVLTDATAELAFALILAISRRVVELDRLTREGRFTHWAPTLYLGHEVTGKTLGIIGMGKIGQALARRAKGFNMRILYHNRNRIDISGENMPASEYVSMNKLLQEADFVSLNVPLTGETKHLIGAKELALMKPTAYLINTARGPVVDERALLDCLRKKKIGGAGLDVYENEPALTPGLETLDNVILLPHVGSGTIETRMRMATMAVQHLIAGLSGQVPEHLVNPEALSNRRQ
jgi:glyoxylate reductase